MTPPTYNVISKNDDINNSNTNCAKRHIRPLYVDLGGEIFFCLGWFWVWHSSAQSLIICAVFLLQLILGCLRRAHPHLNDLLDDITFPLLTNQRLQKSWQYGDLCPSGSGRKKNKDNWKKKQRQLNNQIIKLFWLNIFYQIIDQWETNQDMAHLSGFIWRVLLVSPPQELEFQASVALFSLFLSNIGNWSTNTQFLCS